MQIPFANPGEQLRAIHGFHLVVGDDGPYGISGQRLQGLISVGSDEYFVPGKTQRLCECVPQPEVVLD